MNLILLLTCCLVGMACADKVSIRFTKNPDDGSMLVELLDIPGYALTIRAEMVKFTGVILDFVTTTLNKGQTQGSSYGEIKFTKSASTVNVNVAGTNYNFPLGYESYIGFLEGIFALTSVFDQFINKVFPILAALFQ